MNSFEVYIDAHCEICTGRFRPEDKAFCDECYEARQDDGYFLWFGCCSKGFPTPTYADLQIIGRHKETCHYVMLEFDSEKDSWFELHGKTRKRIRSPQHYEWSYLHTKDSQDRE